MFTSHERIRNGLWFGTEERMGWFQTPLAGADVSPSGLSVDGTLINGGGYVYSSVGSHKRYTYEWSGSSAREVAQKMKSYADGSYGRGLIYFIDPLTYDTNVLPARLADPSMALGYEGGTLVYGIDPTEVPATSATPMELPVTAANYNLASAHVGFDKDKGAVFVPIPEGYTLLLGAFYTNTGSGGVYVTKQLSSKVTTTTQKLTPLATSSTVATNTAISGVAGVWVWVGKSSAGDASVTLNGIIGRLIPSEKNTPGDPVLAQLETGHWVGGQGHSGCKFLGKPTYVENAGINGGMVGFAASFVEVGSWSNG